MKQALRVAFGFLILWASVLHAEVRIVIDSGVDSGRPIGVVPFQWAGPGAAPEDIGGIVAADLRNSGKFNPLDRARLPQQPGSAQEVQPAAWSALGIDAVVVGQVTPNPDGSYNVAYQLVDTGGAPGTVLAQNSYKVNKQWLRYAGHTASDEVFEN
ncbi:translocation protein TolB [Escherichia coli]|mgnify:FL=1|uniref:Translocation protein TolB n=1 Tax=Escherichia coli TaxID=562 RepID=A0A377DIV2_ECOLX|nr:translocation protein TolB [Escherichia coli]